MEWERVGMRGRINRRQADADNKKWKEKRRERRKEITEQDIDKEGLLSGENKVRDAEWDVRKCKNEDEERWIHRGETGDYYERCGR